MHSSLFEQYARCADLFDEMRSVNRARGWVDHVERECRRAFDPEKNGNLTRWIEAYEQFPQVQVESVNLDTDAVTCRGSLKAEESLAVDRSLRALAPWRKGPFQVFDTFIDTEWRSNLKWDRLKPHLDLKGKLVLDVGCGNGYYGWRMLAEGADCVMGIDPSLLYVMQHATLRRCFGQGRRNFVLPVGDTVLPANLRIFDTVFSMGVLYHRKSPIEHLQALYHALQPGGDVVLETLVIEGGEREVLIPDERYAMMKNVWFLPSCGLLCQMMKKCGFEAIKTVSLARTTVDEQRSTPWMTFDSLADFLDQSDPERTIEGYPAPLRAILTARRG